MPKKHTYKRPKITGVYKINNLINGKCYVGKSLDIAVRWSQHIISSQKVWNQLHMYNSMRKHGLENFTFQILIKCSPEELDSYELAAIKLYQPKYNTQHMGKENNGNIPL